MQTSVSEDSTKKNWIVLIVSIVLAIIAAVLTSFYLDNKEQEIRDSLVGKKEVLVPIVVPKFDVAIGDLVSNDNMVVRKIPERFVPDGAFHPSEFPLLVGRSIAANISGGKPLLENSISGVGIEQFSDLLEDGERAITLPMDEFNSTAGLLVAGDRIDLFLLAKENKIKGRKGNDNKSSAMYLVLENALVLATGKSTINDAEVNKNLEDGFDQYNTITLGVPLRDAGRIGLARKDGDFVAMLRNRQDVKRVSYRYLDSLDVYDNVAGKKHEVEYIVGGSSIPGIASVNKQLLEVNKLEKKATEMQELNEMEESNK